MLKKILKFITLDIWRIRLKDMPRRFSVPLKTLRVVILSLKEFHKDKCQLRAASLTYYSLLSIVPIVAMSFGIAKGFGFKENLENRVLELFAGQEEVIHKVLIFSTNLLERTKGSLMAFFGIIMLFYYLIKLIGHIENAFNKIWVSLLQK